jgi:hypothetical protein
VSQRRGVDVRYDQLCAFDDQRVDCVRRIGAGDVPYRLATVHHGSTYLSPPAAQRAVSLHPPRYRPGFALRCQEAGFEKHLAAALGAVSNAGVTPRREETLAFRAGGLYRGLAREDTPPRVDGSVRDQLPDTRQWRGLGVGRRHMVSGEGSVKTHGDDACLSFDDLP